MQIKAVALCRAVYGREEGEGEKDLTKNKYTYPVSAVVCYECWKIVGMTMMCSEKMTERSWDWRDCRVAADTTSSGNSSQPACLKCRSISHGQFWHLNWV